MNNFTSLMNAQTTDLQVLTSKERTSQYGNETVINANIATITDAIHTAERAKDKVDYSVAVLVYALSKIPAECYKSLNIHYTEKNNKGETVDVFVDSYTKYCIYEFGRTQSHYSKLSRVAERFLKVNNADNFLKLQCTDSAQYAIDKEATHKFEIVANFNDVTGLCDRYGYAFNVSQLAEMLTYSTEEITKAIEDGTIDSTTSASGKDGIRDTLKALYKADSTSQNVSNDNVEPNDNAPQDSTTYIVQNTDTARLSTILSILDTLENEKTIESKFVKDFVQFINVTIAHQ
jgi:hypothetical protein